MKRFTLTLIILLSFNALGRDCSNLIDQADYKIKNSIEFFKNIDSTELKSSCERLLFFEVEDLCTQAQGKEPHYFGGVRTIVSAKNSSFRGALDFSYEVSSYAPQGKLNIDSHRRNHHFFRIVKFNKSDSKLLISYEIKANSAPFAKIKQDVLFTKEANKLTSVTLRERLSARTSWKNIKCEL